MMKAATKGQEDTEQRLSMLEKFFEGYVSKVKSDKFRNLQDGENVIVTSSYDAEGESEWFCKISKNARSARNPHGRGRSMMRADCVPIPTSQLSTNLYPVEKGLLPPANKERDSNRDRLEALGNVIYHGSTPAVSVFLKTTVGKVVFEGTRLTKYDLESGLFGAYEDVWLSHQESMSKYRDMQRDELKTRTYPLFDVTDYDALEADEELGDIVKNLKPIN